MRKRVTLALVLSCLLPATVHARQAPDDTALIRAIRANDLTGARSALSSRGHSSHEWAYGDAPLALAVDTQNPAMVALLLKSGADPDHADDLGLTPLALACELGDPGIVLQLVDAHADVRKAGPGGTAPLAVCARFSSAETIRRMLAAGAVPDSIDARGQTPLMWAASAGNEDAMRLLLDAGADANRVSQGGFTPLFFAIKSGRTEPVQLLLDAGADHTFRGPEKTSAVQLAMYQRNYGAAAILIKRGADVSARDRRGLQLLHQAAAAGDAGLVRLLLAEGADPNGLSGPSRIKWVTEANFGVPPPPVPPAPPLFIAAANGNAEVMKLLVQAGAQGRYVAGDGTSVVHAAAKGGSASALEYALNLAPDANHADAGGNTPLHVLLGNGLQPELESMMRVLARHGARVDMANKQGYSARDLAENSLSEVKEMFVKVFAGPIAILPARAQATPAEQPKPAIG